MLHKMIEEIQKNKYRIVLTAMLLVLIFAGYNYFIRDKWIQLKNVQAELDFNNQNKESADYKISKIPEYEKKIEDLNGDIERLKAAFPGMVRQEDIIAKIIKDKENSKALIVNYKLTGIQIVPIMDYYNQIHEKDRAVAEINEIPYEIKGYVMEYNMTLDFIGEFNQLYEFINRLQGLDSGIRINSISVSTYGKKGLLHCNIGIAYVGLTDSTDIQDGGDKFEYSGERKSIFIN